MPRLKKSRRRDPQKRGYLGRFEKHRGKFEQIARSKHQRGQVEITG